MRIAINGLGRIGRCVFRLWAEQQTAKHSSIHQTSHQTSPHTPQNRWPDLELVAVNDKADPDALIHLLRYDSAHGRWPMHIPTPKLSVTANGEHALQLGEKSLWHGQFSEPEHCPWQALGIDWVLETSGAFRTHDQAARHQQAGAKRVLIGAPAFDAVDATVVYGVNHACLQTQKSSTNDLQTDTNQQLSIVSNASCTTNALATICLPIQQAFGIESGLVTEVHAYTVDQSLVDKPHHDLRRGRAAAHNLIPTPTIGTQCLGLVLPELEGKIDGYSMRVPTLTVACIDLTLVLTRTPTIAELHAVMQRAATHELAGVLAYNDEPLVSSDFKGHSASAVFDATQTRQVGQQVKILAWYDNEWGYAHRLLDVLQSSIE